MVLFVVSADAVHLFEVCDITGSNGFPTIHPELAEVDRTTIEVGDFSNKKLAMFLPVLDFNATTDDGLFANNVQSTILRTQA